MSRQRADEDETGDRCRDRDPQQEKVPVSEWKAGLSVVVDACGDSLKDLEVVEVRIVPAAGEEVTAFGSP